MSTIIGGSSPSITFSDSTTQASAGLTAASPTIASGVLTFPDATTQSSGSGVAKAWVDFNAVGGTVSIRASYNISSITRLSTGDYQINLINAVTDANFSFACSGCQNESPSYTGLAIGAAPASSSQLRATYRKFDNTSIDPLYASAVIFR